MAGLFANYEQQYGTLTAAITAKTAKLANLAGDDRYALIRNIDKEFEEAKEILEQMGLEVRELGSANRAKFQTRIQSYTAELSRLEQEYVKAKNAASRTREELMGEVTPEDDYSQQKQLLLENGEKLERGSKRLDVGYRIAVETEQIGSTILSDLSQQREVIQRNRERLRRTDDELSRSGRVLNRMMTRIMQNRLILLGVLLALLAVIVVGVYFSVRKHRQ